MKPHLEITEDNLAAMEVFAESNEEPIVMVNLMQVRPHAEYEDPALNDCTGLEAFASVCLRETIHPDFLSKASPGNSDFRYFVFSMLDTSVGGSPASKTDLFGATSRS